MSNEYKPDVVYSPGETLKELLKARGTSKAVLAEHIGCTVKVVDDILEAKKEITGYVAQRLGHVLGVPWWIWMSLDESYWAHVKREDTSHE